LCKVTLRIVILIHSTHLLHRQSSECPALSLKTRKKSRHAISAEIPAHSSSSLLFRLSVSVTAMTPIECLHRITNHTLPQHTSGSQDKWCRTSRHRARLLLVSTAQRHAETSSSSDDSSAAKTSRTDRKCPRCSGQDGTHCSTAVTALHQGASHMLHSNRDWGVSAAREQLLQCAEELRAQAGVVHQLRLREKCTRVVTILPRNAGILQRSGSAGAAPPEPPCSAMALLEPPVAPPRHARVRKRALCAATAPPLRAGCPCALRSHSPAPA
jgi:hypothetical protein